MTEYIFLGKDEPQKLVYLSKLYYAWKNMCSPKNIADFSNDADNSCGEAHVL